MPPYCQYENEQFETPGHGRQLHEFCQPDGGVEEEVGGEEEGGYYGGDEGDCGWVSEGCSWANVFVWGGAEVK